MTTQIQITLDRNVRLITAIAFSEVLSEMNAYWRICLGSPGEHTHLHGSVLRLNRTEPKIFEGKPNQLEMIRKPMMMMMMMIISLKHFVGLWADKRL